MAVGSVSSRLGSNDALDETWTLSTFSSTGVDNFGGLFFNEPPSFFLTSDVGCKSTGLDRSFREDEALAEVLPTWTCTTFSATGVDDLGGLFCDEPPSSLLLSDVGSKSTGLDRSRRQYEALAEFVLTGVDDIPCNESPSFFL